MDCVNNIVLQLIFTTAGRIGVFMPPSFIQTAVYGGTGSV